VKLKARTTGLKHLEMLIQNTLARPLMLEERR